MPTTLAVTDRLSIKRLFAQYAWAVATDDTTRFAGLFTPEATVEVDGDVIPAPDYLTRLRDGERIPSRQDWTNQSQIRATDDGVTVRSFGMTTARFSSGSTAIAWLGYYDDVLRVGGDGDWLFASRAIRPWSGDVLKNFPTFAPIPHEQPRR
jgi:hypothetical protein